ncbi:patatin-like phospholipase domain-containing protein 2 [Clupea harengus]|uniref:Patatin-like phospholipase domain-containing protein 2 n=1 Tax=Clupea harengus TaxID=7950 RepID=A0A6P8F1L3_CLUHA|nr:patatin-like phospholipase domain-containing protein 2 [Clupea harengus]
MWQKIRFTMYPLSDVTAYEGTPLSISFSGSGFLSTYQLGVSQCFFDNAPWIIGKKSKVYGSSAGALVAAAVVCGASMGGVRDDVIEFAKLVREHSFGPFHPAVNVFKWMENIMRRRLPLDAHERCNGRLCISMTRVPDGNNVIMSEFKTHEDLIQALLCSCFIPMYCGVIPPSYKGVHYVDGGLTNIQPTQTTGYTLTISPFAGGMDICPQDDTSPSCDFVVNGQCFHPTLLNLFRATTALYPRDWKVLSEAYVNGYQDGVQYLQHHGIIQQKQNLVTRLHSNSVTRTIEGKFPLPEENEIEEHDERPAPKATPQDREGIQRLVNAPWGLNILEQALNSNTPGWIQNVFLYDMSLFGLMGFFSLYFPIRLFTILLISCILPFWVIFMVTYRFLRWIIFAPMAVFWLWQDLKQIVFFVNNFILSTVKQNLRNRLLLFLSLLPSLEVNTEYENSTEVSRGHRGISVLKVALLSSASHHQTDSVTSGDRHVCTLQLILE